MTSSDRSSAIGLPGAALLGAVLLLGCTAPPSEAPRAHEAPDFTPSKEYPLDPIRAHEAVIAVVANLGEKVEEDRGDGRYVQSTSNVPREDGSRLRTRFWISGQERGGTLVTVRRSVVCVKAGREIEWTSLPDLPDGSWEVLDALDRRVQRR